MQMEPVLSQKDFELNASTSSPKLSSMCKRKLDQEVISSLKIDSLSSSFSDVNMNVSVSQISHRSESRGRARERSTLSTNDVKVLGKHQSGMTLWKILMTEFNIDSNGNDSDSTQSHEYNPDYEYSTSSLEMLVNFIKLPVYLETFMGFGLFYSLVVFLKSLVTIPLRFIIQTLMLVQLLQFKKRKLNFQKLIQYKNDTLSVILLVSTLFLLKNLDTSRIYHNIRAGTAVKLYFMVGLLEIADKLLSASGQDILKLLYNLDFVCETSNKIRFNWIKFLGVGFALLLTIIYLWLHSYILVYEVMALNVAINSYSNALLTLILSNQFAELKSAVFKRTEREGLFQIACADLNERFLLLVMLIIISSRNLLQICINSASIHDLFNNMKPNSWYSHLTSSKHMDDWIGLLMGPIIVMIGSEVLVDWLKHSYIIRFNHIRPKIYKKYIAILANDYVDGFTANNLGRSGNKIVEEFPSMLTKRTGFPVFTAIIVFCKLTVFPWLSYYLANIAKRYSIFVSAGLGISIVFLMVFLRLILSLALFKWSKKLLRARHTMKPLADYVKGSPNVTLTDISDTRKMLYTENEIAPPTLEDQRIQKTLNRGDEKLNAVLRFEMSDKNIW